MPVDRNERIATARRHIRRYGKRIGKDATLRRAGRRELRGLRNVLAEHELRLDGLPQALSLERLLGGTAVGGVFRIGDGKALNAPVFERRPQIGKVGIGRERRALGSKENGSAFRVERTAIGGLA